jgi:hypothetical protein
MTSGRIAGAFCACAFPPPSLCERAG